MKTLSNLALAIYMVNGAITSVAQEPPQDFTNATLESLGVELVKPHKDPKTGFMIGGKNPTSLIGKLTEIADLSIAKLEKRMRPGADSKMGFIGKEESLLEVLAADNRLVVDEWKLTHQDLAKHLHIIGAITAKHAAKMPFAFRYHGKTFRAEAAFSKGIQQSPFDDETKTNCNATVENLGSKKKFTFSLLVPHMIERYGFYEGKGTPYRVDPRVIVDVLDFIKHNRL